MYAKCGRIDCAREAFCFPTKKKDIVLWITMLEAWAGEGLSGEVLKIFNQMQPENVPLNAVSWNSLMFDFFRNIVR